MKWARSEWRVVQSGWDGIEMRHYLLTIRYHTPVIGEVFGHNRPCLCLTNFILHSTSNPKCHVTFLKTKMIVNFNSKCHLDFGLHDNLGKLIIWLINMQSWFLTKKKLSIKRKYPSVLHVAPNVEDSSPFHGIHFKPTKGDPNKSIKGLQVQLIAQVTFDCILNGKSSFTLPRLVPS